MIQKKFNVLDHGYIKLIDFMGSDETVIEAARMSTGKGFQGWEPGMRCKDCGWREDSAKFEYDNVIKDKCDRSGSHNMEKVTGDVNLLDYLWRMGHATPFEMCEIHVEVLAPVLVWRQWMRHRTFSYNEASARYSMMPNEHYMPEPDRFEPKKTGNKQESSTGQKVGPNSGFRALLRGEQEQVYHTYEELIGNGVPNETARLNTPVSRYSKARVKTDLRNWLGFLKLRMHPHAQWEIRQYANVMGLDIIRELFPRTWRVFNEHTLYGVHFSRTEMAAVQSMLIDMPTESLFKYAKEQGLEGSKATEFVNKMKSGGLDIL